MPPAKLQNGVHITALIIGPPGSASGCIEDSVRALSLGARAMTNPTAPPMQPPATPFPNAGYAR